MGFEVGRGTARHGAGRWRGAGWSGVERAGMSVGRSVCGGWGDWVGHAVVGHAVGWHAVGCRLAR